MVVITQILDNSKKPVIIALNIEKTKVAHKVNDIASIYGKSNVHQIIDWINEVFLKYSHRNRALAFARFHRLSLPKNATISEGSNSTIIDESPDVKPYDEKNANKILLQVTDPDNLVWVASPAETVSQAREYAASIDLAAAGKTDVDLYGNKLSEIFENWDSTDPMTGKRGCGNFSPKCALLSRILKGYFRENKVGRAENSHTATVNTGEAGKAGKAGKAAMTIASFLKYDDTNSENSKSENENNDEIRFSDKSINRCFLRDMPGEWFGFCLHFGFHNVVGHIKTVAYVVIFQLYHCKAVAGVALYSFGVLTVHVQTHPAET